MPGPLITPITPYDSQTVVTVYADPSDGRGFLLNDLGIYTLQSSEPWFYSDLDGQDPSVMIAVAANEAVVLIVDGTFITKYVKTREPYRATILVKYAIFNRTDVPEGGAAGQVLVKSSNADGDTEWADPGAPFPSTYIHNQAAPAATWVINHNLNRYPAVTTIDSAGTMVHGGLAYISTNQVVVSFSAAFSGKAFLN